MKMIRRIPFCSTRIITLQMNLLTIGFCSIAFAVGFPGHLFTHYDCASGQDLDSPSAVQRVSDRPVLSSSPKSGTEPLGRSKPAQPEIKYAIVLHGGAGTAPSQYSAEKNAARRKSLEKALNAGLVILKKGGSSLDAVESVIRTMEDDPIFNAGKGAVYNARGNFELDASIMDGSNRACGAVAGVTIVKNPISLARKVMTETRHVLLSSAGANEFAKQQKVDIVPNQYFQTPVTRARWERQNRSKKKDSSKSDSGKPSGKNASSTDYLQPPSYYGTVGCVALDQDGNIAAGTSTGGLSNKKFGRVGDSPILGAGTYASNETCGVSGTGIGEEFIRNAVAFDVSARMKYKNLPLSKAAREVIHEVLKKNVGGIIALDRQGNIAIEYNTKGMSSAAADSNGRFEINWGK